MPTADTPEKMARMRHWLDAVATELDIDPIVIAKAENPVLNLINNVAHGPSRPGAPLSAFLVGYAVAATGGDVAEITARVDALLETYSYDEDE